MCPKIYYVHPTLATIYFYYTEIPNKIQGLIQDSPQEGDADPPRGRPHMTLPIFSKYCMKLRKFLGRRGWFQSCPLRSAAKIKNWEKVIFYAAYTAYCTTVGSMIISLSMNITMNRLGGASVIAIFTTRRSHGYVNTTTWLGISQFFLFLVPNFNILTTENRSRCNRDLN